MSLLDYCILTARVALALKPKASVFSIMLDAKATSCLRRNEQASKRTEDQTKEKRIARASCLNLSTNKLHSDPQTSYSRGERGRHSKVFEDSFLFGLSKRVH